MGKLVTALFAIALASSSVVAQAAVLVVDGDFENGLTGWTQSGNTTFQHIAHSDNGNHYFSDGAIGSAGFLGQQVATVAGTRYDLSFDLRGATLGGINHFDVVFGQPIPAATKDNFEIPLFTHFMFKNLLAADKTTLLRFASRSDESFILLDNVALQVSPVPEPGTYAMLLIGLGLLGAAVRKRRQ